MKKIIPLVCVITIILIIVSCKIKTRKGCIEKHRITEKGIDTVNFSKLVNVREKMANLFFCYEIQQALAHQDGPSIYVLNIIDENDKLLTVNMNEEDTSKISRVLFFSPKIYDEYGLHIGDKFSDIKRQRKNVKWITDFNQDTYVYEEGSNISYVIYGDFSVEDLVNPEKPEFTQNQIMNWEIERIEWINRK